MILRQERQQLVGGYFFLPASCLSATACLFFWSALLALACFWLDFFWLDFGDLSPIILIFFSGLTHLRHVRFSEGIPIVVAGAVIVNDERKIIRQRWSGCVNARKQIHLTGTAYFSSRFTSTRSMRRSGTSHRRATNTYRPFAIHGLTDTSRTGNTGCRCERNW